MTVYNDDTTTSDDGTHVYRRSDLWDLAYGGKGFATFVLGEPPPPQEKDRDFLAAAALAHQMGAPGVQVVYLYSRVPSLKVPATFDELATEDTDHQLQIAAVSAAMNGGLGLGPLPRAGGLCPGHHRLGRGHVVLRHQLRRLAHPALPGHP